ncbi:SWIM zinc finger family protein [Halobellus ruber]|nr:SWIM zinc finger family protein [Halobellus ruber]
MTVWPLRDGRYLVAREGRTYVVDAERATCTCPDSTIRGARCKHVRRVAIEIDAGTVPAPDERERPCAVCGGPAFVAADADGPALCARHDHAPGDLVADRETGNLLVVASATGRRADDVRTDENRLVADYDTNAAYGRHEPVFAARYVDALPGRRAAAPGRTYLFPASRLRPVEVDSAATDRSTDPGRERCTSAARAG